MKNIAVVPWSASWEGGFRDNIFNLDPSSNSELYLNFSCVWKEMQDYLAKRGYSFHTIDLFPDLRKVDLFVFFWFDISWYERVRKAGGLEKSVYVAMESPAFDPNNSPEGLERMRRHFAYILYMDDDLIDNRRIFKFMCPYHFFVEKSRFLINQEDFNEKKLLCVLCGNKTSNYKTELYSERKRVIEYYDGRPDFGLYGPGWESENYKSYKGVVKHKSEVHKDYKFALCLENYSGQKGTISEKIFDCFCSGIVPVYFGAPDCSAYIPDDCYIHYDAFRSLEELDRYLSGMEFDEYKGYLDRIEQYLASDKLDVFSPERWAETLIEILNRGPVDGISGNIFPYKMKLSAIRWKKRAKHLYRILTRTNGSA